MDDDTLYGARDDAGAHNNNNIICQSTFIALLEWKELVTRVVVCIYAVDIPVIIIIIIIIRPGRR